MACFNNIGPGFDAVGANFEGTETLLYVASVNNKNDIVPVNLSLML